MLYKYPRVMAQALELDSRRSLKLTANGLFRSYQTGVTHVAPRDSRVLNIMLAFNSVTVKRKSTAAADRGDLNIPGSGHADISAIIPTGGLITERNRS